MGLTEQRTEGMVTRQFLMITALIALVSGFLAGVIFSSFQTTGPPPSTSQNTAKTGGGLSSEQAAKILALEQEVSTNPQNGAAWTSLGHVYFDNGRYLKAINAYQKSLALNEEQPDVWTDLGVMYRRSKQPEKAITAFDRAVVFNPAHEQARFNKGIVLMYDMGDKEAAIKVWQELLAINPEAQAPNGQKLAEMIASF